MDGGSRRPASVRSSEAGTLVPSPGRAKAEAAGHTPPLPPVGFASGEELCPTGS